SIAMPNGQVKPPPVNPVAGESATPTGLNLLSEAAPSLAVHTLPSASTAMPAGLVSPPMSSYVIASSQSTGGMNNDGWYGAGGKEGGRKKGMRVVTGVQGARHT